MSDNMVHLAFRTPTVGTSNEEILACILCKNKTWTARYTAAGDGFPNLQCAACGQIAGTFGWMTKGEQ